MLLAFHNAFADSRVSGSAIDSILPILTKIFQNQFCHYVDGGAGVGSTALQYNNVLESNLENHIKPNASIICYEPLVENFAEMSKRLAAIERCVLRNVAISSSNGTTKFAVPQRQTEDKEHWGRGTSFAGSIHDGMRNVPTVDVQMVRIEDDLSESPDFIKLDLQGGELEAIKGVGEMLPDVKVLYVETQLLRKEHTCQYLNENGFIVHFDKFQFGLRADLSEVPFKKLSKLGTCIDRMWTPKRIDMPLVVWGYVAKGRDLFEDFGLTDKARNMLFEDVGISYFQTDAICINKTYADQIYTCLNKII